jgi:hypothetical protein
MSRTLASILSVFSLLAVAATARAASPIMIDPLPISTGGGNPPPIQMPPIATCQKTLDEHKDLSWDTGIEHWAKLAWSAGLGAGVGVVADCNQLAVQGSLSINASIFGNLVQVKPLEVQLSAATKSDHSNTITLNVLAFDHTIKSYPIASSPTPLTGGFDVGYVLPDGTLDGSWDAGDFDVSYNTSVSIAADIAYNVSPTEVKVTMLSGADASAVVSASLSIYGYTKRVTTGLNILRLTQGGHLQLKQDVGNTWKADVGNFLEMDDVLGLRLALDWQGTPNDPSDDWVPIENKPKQWSNTYTYTHSFTKSF